MGSLRNKNIPILGNELRTQGFDVFDDWWSNGYEADDWLWEYEKGRGHSYLQALKGFAAQHIFEFDKKHLNRCEAGVLLLPAGKSCHLELGYILGQGKLGYILLDKLPERIDVMYNFASGVFDQKEQLFDVLRGERQFYS